jgi:chromosomal replication initiation ATPase DnaA
MTDREQQLLLDLGLRPALSREDFLVADSNAAAVALIDQWADWPSYATLIVGPAGSGKSHLVEVWRQVSGAQKCQANAIELENIPELFSGGALAIEDIDQVPLPETAIFHAMNYARQQKMHLLFTARSRPEHWPVDLPDLASRFHALPSVEILSPDDALLRGVLVKHFTDRQIAVDEALIAYMILRMPRSLEAAGQLVHLIDDAALRERAEVTRSFVAKVMANYESPDLF